METPDDSHPLPHVIPGGHESPLEERMSDLLIKALDDATTWKTQVNVRTAFGDFRLDALLVAPDGRPRVAIECDGARHHRGSRDEWRDAAILGEGFVDAILRVRGRDLYLRPADVLHALCVRLPMLFSARGRENAARLASQEIRDGLAEYPDTILAWYSQWRTRDGRREREDDHLHIRVRGLLGDVEDNEWMWRYEALQQNPHLPLAAHAAQEDAEFEAVLRAAMHRE